MNELRGPGRERAVAPATVPAPQVVERVGVRDGEALQDRGECPVLPLVGRLHVLDPRPAGRDRDHERRHAVHETFGGEVIEHVRFAPSDRLQFVSR
jgi:hypothetical protein